MSRFLDTVISSYNDMRARAFAGGYEGVTHAGIALVSHEDDPVVLLAQRSYDETDDPEVRESWEFPGGGLEGDEQPYQAALREFLEETGLTIPDDATVVNGWRSKDGVYQGFVVQTLDAIDVEGWQPTSECQAVGLFTREMIAENENLRPEVRDGTPWDLIFGVSGNEEDTMTAAGTETEPDYTDWALAPEPLLIHGVIAPEDTESGDGRGFNAGAMTKRPLRLPFSHQQVSNPGHDKSQVAGSVDRMMRSGGLIHFEGLIMPDSPAAEDVAALIAFFGRYGVSVDGDRGSMDVPKSEASGMVWFDAVRAAGLTSVHIPAFSQAYVAFGPHPTMPNEDDEALTASLTESNSIVGARALEFKRGPGWVTDPKATNRIHDYWTKPGEPGYEKIGWGKPGDFARAKALIGAKIAEHSPHAMKYLNQIIAQWHHDALGYWPATHAKMDRAGKATTKAAMVDQKILRLAAAEVEREDIMSIEDADDIESAWEAVLVSSASAGSRPPSRYFTRQDDTDALVISEPDENGYRHTYGYIAEWGVCHIGFANRCVEPPRTYSDEYPQFHLGRTRTDDGYVKTGLLTYGVGHRDAKTILTQSATQQHFDNIRNAWAAVVCGEDDRGIWFSGVVLPKVDMDDVTLIEATGQISGEWRGGALRVGLAVNVPGFPVLRASVEYDDEGNVAALVASAHRDPYPLLDTPEGLCAGDESCMNSPAFAVVGANGDPDAVLLVCASHTDVSAGERTCTEETPAQRMAVLAAGYAEMEMDVLREQFNWVDVAERLVNEAADEGRVEPVGLRDDGAIVYELDGEVPGTDTVVEPMPSEVD